MAAAKLVVEMNENYREDEVVAALKQRGVGVTPPLGRDEDWLLRVKLCEDQALVAFPKFYTIGIGFQIEDASWNTNLPYSTEAETIYNHIKCNKKYRAITKRDCIRAIKMLQDEAKKLRERGLIQGRM